jgi:hypothetical protein
MRPVKILYEDGQLAISYECERVPALGPNGRKFRLTAYYRDQSTAMDWFDFPGPCVAYSTAGRAFFHHMPSGPERAVSRGIGYCTRESGVEHWDEHDSVIRKFVLSPDLGFVLDPKDGLYVCFAQPPQQIIFGLPEQEKIDFRHWPFTVPESAFVEEAEVDEPRKPASLSELRAEQARLQREVQKAKATLARRLEHAGGKDLGYTATAVVGALRAGAEPESRAGVDKGSGVVDGSASTVDVAADAESREAGRPAPRVEDGRSSTASFGIVVDGSVRRWLRSGNAR